ncbi:Universal stress protein family protein [Tranquillimonas rosea]|uniref:Universal stress protein family protein n=1 Tax=Tranquillimonas rosea TaxID=641238 RepID=A0A1H9Q0T6_9RHOB|nr:universal stress protein [Tranquillimonas rosea]SER54071.1 Universal stress protein family protein [Tranquillimonas rosea]
MTYRTLSTIVPPPGPETVDAAVALAERWGAHLDVICAGEIHADPAWGPEGISMLSVTLAEADTEACEKVEAAIRKRLERESIAWTCRSVTGPLGEAARQAARAARYSDLAILPRPLPDQLLAEAAFETVLLEAKVPVLLPAEGATPSFERIMIAWDESDESMTAVRTALPLLQTADAVQVVVVDPKRHSPDTADAGHPVAVYLSRHDVHCEIAQVPRVLPRISETLVQSAREFEADLVVMGAYGHSRVREALIGGVTREMIKRTDLPLFVAH